MIIERITQEWDDDNNLYVNTRKEEYFDFLVNVTSFGSPSLNARVFPNPAKHTVNMELPAYSHNVMIEVISMHGSLIKSLQTQGDIYHSDRTPMPPKSYGGA